jgi:putative transposase
MPRKARYVPGGLVYHILNRGVSRRKLFEKDRDYIAFEGIVAETLIKCPMRICGYCIMPNHWHFVLWPECDGELATFMQRLTVTHVTRWQKQRRVVGEGHVYQGRYKSFPVETDEYFYQVLRYVERNALRAGLAKKAEDWPWCSLWRHIFGTPKQRSLLSTWPLPRPRTWVEHVNQAQTDAEADAVRRSIARGSPFGSSSWMKLTAKRLGLESTLRPRGRPRTSRL